MEKNTCENCGAPLPANSPSGLCPACLMAEAMDSLDPVPGETLAEPHSPPGFGPDPLEGSSLGIGGRYKILQRIGEGGFGTVFMAEQSVPMRRRVAIKVLKAGMDTRQLLARFEAESQALAMMDHPNIARVFDSGETPEGRPYFVMELVRGIPITTFCDNEELDTLTRLGLFVQVCRAVQHAHQKGIIHRDLKPGNVLITVQHGAEPVPKVIDFGVAKAMETPLTDKTLFTRFEQMIGTPSYMSPEQAGAAAATDIDTRSDIYALGVLLYELLTGTTPIKAETLQQAAFDEVRRLLREEEPPRPSTRLSSLEQDRRTTVAKERHTEPATLGKQLCGDLDWIVMCAIEKDRRRRYETANALAKDVERHLNNEPVTAGAPSTGYRTRKFIRRHRRWISVGAGVALVLIVATAYSTWQASRAIAAERRTTATLGSLQIAYHDLDSAKKDADTARNETRTVLVRTLLEKGTRQFNAGEMTGLITLQEAAQAAAGDEGLTRQSLELWSLARAWLPGEVCEVFDEPYAQAISPDGTTVVWCDGENLHSYATELGSYGQTAVAPRVLAVTPHANGDHLDVLAMLFSPDGQLLAIHNPEKGVAQVWDVVTWEPVTDVLSHPNGPLPPSSGSSAPGKPRVKFSPDGRMLATMAVNGTICLWNLKEGQSASAVWTVNSRPRGLDFSPDGSLLAFGFGSISELQVSIYNINVPGKPRQVSEIRGSAYELGVTEVSQLDEGLTNRPAEFQFLDQTHLAVRATDWAMICDLETGRSVGQGQVGFSEALELSGDREVLAVGTRDGKATLRTSDTFELIGNPLDHGGGGVRGLGFAPDGCTLATGGLDGTLQLWSVPELCHRFAIWPQPGVIDAIHTPTRGNGLYLTKSRSRDSSQPTSLILRKFPEKLDRSIATLPAGTTLMDVTSDGETLLVRSKCEKRLHLLDLASDRNGDALPLQRGPETENPEAAIVGAAFSPDERAIIFSSMYDGRQEYRRWDLTLGRFTNDRFQTENPWLPIGAVLPTSPPLVGVGWMSWRLDLVDLEKGRKIHTIRLANRPSCMTIADKLGWYAVGDLNGTLRRFRLETHEEIQPPIRCDEMLSGAVCSGDNQWLVTKQWDNRLDLYAFRAWYLHGGLPFQSIKLPSPHGRVGRIFAVEDRSFVFQEGDELKRFDLPDGVTELGIVKPATTAALGVRKDAAGELRLLTSEEYHQAKSLAEP